MTLGKSYIIMGIYYGFPIILSMGPSHLRLLQTRGLAQGKKGIQETKAARLGFILGQLIIFVSVYNTPLAQPLGRPHIMTLIAIPYLFGGFFLSNRMEWAYHRIFPPKPRSVFWFWRIVLQSAIRHLANPGFFPSAVLLRAPSLLIYQCKSEVGKIGLLLGIFIGWLIGHILLMESIVFILTWIHHNFIKSHKIIRPNSQLAKNPLVIELRHTYVDLMRRMDELFNIGLFLLCLYSLATINHLLLMLNLETLEK
ncbi:Protein TIC 214 [Linum perenne]